MRVIDNVIVSDSILEEEFVCDLEICKGRCCEEGDSGAPLTEEELAILEDIFPSVKPYLSKNGLLAIESRGLYMRDKDFVWVTPCVTQGSCAYVVKDKDGYVRCAIEKAFHEGRIRFQKPVSCHIFPVRIKRSPADEGTEFWNYQPRPDLCATSRIKGRKLGVPLYEFLKEPIIRAKGDVFYRKLKAEAEKIKSEK